MKYAGNNMDIKKINKKASSPHEPLMGLNLQEISCYSAPFERGGKNMGKL